MTQAQRDRVAGAVNRFTDAQIALANARHAKANGNHGAIAGYVRRAKEMHRIGLRDLRSATTTAGGR
jgi:hypothetical protein